LHGGVRLIQLRSKTGIDPVLLAKLLGLTRPAGALLIVNDFLEGALQADGLHVGPEDLARLPAASLRERLGERVLGISCGDPDEVPQALRLGADYIGAGPYAATSTKADAGPPIGAEGIARVVRAAGECPVAAIGAIGLADLAPVAATGARMAAVLSAFAASADPQSTAAAMVARWQMHSR
jgi:thiamine-phosphate pyrophosphorylase